MRHDFAQTMSFLDPQLTSDGKPYAPHRFRELSKEKYLISKYCNTSYSDVDKITPTERKYILEFIYEEKLKEQQAYEEAIRNKK